MKSTTNVMVTVEAVSEGEMVKALAMLDAIPGVVAWVGDPVSDALYKKIDAACGGDLEYWADGKMWADVVRNKKYLP